MGLPANTIIMKIALALLALAMLVAVNAAKHLGELDEHAQDVRAYKDAAGGMAILEMMTRGGVCIPGCECCCGRGPLLIAPCCAACGLRGGCGPSRDDCAL